MQRGVRVDRGLRLSRTANPTSPATPSRNASGPNAGSPTSSTATSNATDGGSGPPPKTSPTPSRPPVPGPALTHEPKPPSTASKKNCTTATASTYKTVLPTPKYSTKSRRPDKLPRGRPPASKSKPAGQQDNRGSRKYSTPPAVNSAARCSPRKVGRSYKPGSAI
jgi:hypothetical protein